METVYTNPVDAAKAIRKELKQKFPAIKFSVTTKKYTGGNSININWVLGPTESAVKAVVNKYEYGRFDGMTDYAYNENTLVSCPDGQVKILGGAKHVFTNRSFGKTYQESNEFVERVAHDVCVLQKVAFLGMNTNIYGNDEWNHNETVSFAVGRILSAQDLTKGYAGLKWAADSGSGWENRCEVIEEDEELV